MHLAQWNCQQVQTLLFATALALFSAQAALAADECVPARPAAALAAAKAGNSVVLQGADARIFAGQARAAGVPLPDADYVFLQTSAVGGQLEWLEGTSEPIAMQCGWQAKAGSVVAELIARWAQR